jgi:hypothetical protein
MATDVLRDGVERSAGNKGDVMSESTDIRAVIKALTTAGQDDHPWVLDAIEAWKRRVYTDLRGTKPTPQEVVELTDGLMGRCLGHGIGADDLSHFKETFLEYLRGLQPTESAWKTSVWRADGTLNVLKKLLESARPAARSAQPGNGTVAEKTKAQKQGLEPAASKAYSAFGVAEFQARKPLADYEAYQLLKEKGIPENVGEGGELTDYRLPSFETWARHLRTARNTLGQQKYTRRAGRPLGKSVVRVDQIDQR